MTARGNGRLDLYRDVRDRQDFGQLLAEMAARLRRWSRRLSQGA
jgi:hypothetical protein